MFSRLDFKGSVLETCTGAGFVFRGLGVVVGTAVFVYGWSGFTVLLGNVHRLRTVFRKSEFGLGDRHVFEVGFQGPGCTGAGVVSV